MRIHHFLFLVALTSLFACRTNRAMPDLETFELDTLTVTAPPLDANRNQTSLYRASADKTVDLVHTKLDIQLDWQNETVIGEAEITMSPVFYAVDHVVLDAQAFNISAVKLNGQAVDYTYVNDKLDVNLGKTFSKEETFTIAITYTAHPSGEAQNKAIASDKGLFFIDPRDEYEDKPTQVWTQGETTYNSKWFPTIDQPNQRCSQEIYVTVPDSMVSLSNGILVNSKPLENGMRQDYWKQDKPHAPYLFMLAIGDYAVVNDRCVELDIPLTYLVYPEYEKDAKAIYNHTPEMLNFFSEKLGYDYPWDKYAQIIAEDYVSGAMENTSAVIFGEFVQHDARYLADNPNDKIVAHEMMHHWFGDLVTCEDWSNLTMNEGFANYAEYLWFEHKYGHNRAEEHRMEELGAYVSSAQYSTHDLIHHTYESEEDMFDAHSYNKGGLILHMLRNKLGDEAFYAGLKHYLHKHEYSSVEADDLRLAYEEVTGLDLGLFFDQWYFDSGHPQINVQYDDKMITANQFQAPPLHRELFVFDVNPIIYYADGTSDTLSWHVDAVNDTLIYQPKTEVAVVVFDGTHNLLAEIYESNQTITAYNHLLQHSNEFEDIVRALIKLEDVDAESILRIKEHPYGLIRAIAIEKFPHYFTDSEISKLITDDPSTSARSAALSQLSLREMPNVEELVNKALNDKSYEIENQALYLLSAIDIDAAEQKVDSLIQSNPKYYLTPITEILEDKKDETYLPFYKEYVDDAVEQGIYFFVENYADLAKKAGDEAKADTRARLTSLMNMATRPDLKNLYEQIIAELR